MPSSRELSRIAEGKAERPGCPQGELMAMAAAVWQPLLHSRPKDIRAAPPCATTIQNNSSDLAYRAPSIRRSPACATSARAQVLEGASARSLSARTQDADALVAGAVADR